MLHVFLFFGPRPIVGFLGVVMLVLIGTGIVIHRKILAELFTQRWGRSPRVGLSDLHKCTRSWGLGFHLLIATTGAWMGLAPLFERGYQYLSLGTAAESMASAAARQSAAAAAIAATMPSLDALHAAAQRAVPGLRTRQVSLRRWGSSTAEVGFGGQFDNHLGSTARVEFDAATGLLKNLRDPRSRGFWSQVDSLMEPLHFGDFGGLALKWLYFMLGLSAALLALSGTLIWLDMRQQRQRAAQARVAAPAHGPPGAGGGGGARLSCKDSSWPCTPARPQRSAWPFCCTCGRRPGWPRWRSAPHGPCGRSSARGC